MTKNQREAMLVLNRYLGQTVEVLTSGYTANVAPQAVQKSVGTFSSAALRGLEAQGYIKIEMAYWKGARLTVLKMAEGVLPDIQINNHGSILIFVPRTETGMEWMNENLPESAMRWAGGIVVEPRYAGAIVDGAINDGLMVEG